jgi:rhamnosyltransferase
VVLYHPGDYIVENLNLIVSQVINVVIIANDGKDIERLKGVEKSKIYYFNANGNIGLAAALNYGIEVAKKLGSSWCLLLDQDTTIDSNLIFELNNTYNICTFRENIGILVPNYRSPVGNRLAYNDQVKWQTITSAVTSGSLVSIHAIERTGLMNERFFIECIDTEFCLRVRSLGFQIIASGAALMTHGAGSPEKKEIFGHSFFVTHHPPWRYFYQFRNLIWTLKKYYKNEPHWATMTLISIPKRIFLLIFYENQKILKILAMIRGILTGLISNPNANEVSKK